MVWAACHHIGRRSGLIKQRLARPGAGKRSGYRTVIAYRTGARAFFLLGFAKSARANIDDDELVALKRLAAGLLAAVDQALDAMIAGEDLMEVDCGQSTQD
ncbi:MAG: type II toxin-antitoxin system RelE/ParE family toxin [Caulobacterales bacterium]